jgi:betaine reductase
LGSNPVLRNTAYALAHVPELVRFGSKPRREIQGDPSLADRIAGGLRGYPQAVAYPPNQVFVGNLTPEALADAPRPWHTTPPLRDAALERERHGRFGEIADTALLYALLERADVLEPPLFAVARSARAELDERLASHPLFGNAAAPPGATSETLDDAELVSRVEAGRALPLRLGSRLVGGFHRDERAEGRDDENLGPHNLLENLCSKVSGALALRWLLHREGIEPEAVDFLISCGEEAVGDRYQRGGGGMAKAIGELCGCVRASGMDVKNFCAAPASALVTAGALVKAGLHERVVVVAGGSLAKLGMKLQAFLEHGIPILEDCLAACAFLVTRDDGESPVLHIEPGAVGSAPIGASTSDEAIYRSLLLGPLEALGLEIPAIDRYAPELHNPEIMDFAGSGDVAHKNYRAIAAMAVLAGQLEKAGMDEFVQRVGMPGFAPTQGHIPSGVAYLGHASEAIRSGAIRRAMVLSKASLFLGRCTELYDGVSFVLEANPGEVRC